ncbi:MAG: hypothetical protein ACJ72W_25740, partial [Actinoallomurus sp.]
MPRRVHHRAGCALAVFMPFAWQGPQQEFVRRTPDPFPSPPRIFVAPTTETLGDHSGSARSRRSRAQTASTPA